ncbi:MAG: MFS transporter [Candidatus Heimdallarchaeota archaeon]
MKDKMRQYAGIDELPPTSQQVALKFLALQLTRIASVQIVSTFFILFLLDAITFRELGILLALQLMIIALLDYPTGALGDWIGHKWVLFLAYCCYALGTIILLLANSFEEFLLFGLFSGIGFSQESGALEAWFDNNYRASIGEFDPDRTIYGAYQGKVFAMIGLVSGVSFILGGLVAAAFSRKALFLIQLGLIAVVLVFIILLMNNVEGIEAPKGSLRTYGQQLAGGFRFTVSTRGVFFYMIGASFTLGGIIAIWGSLLLFPYYESYSGSDDYTGLLRAIIFFTSIFWQVIAAEFSKKVSRVRQGIFVTAFMAGPVFFLFAFLYYELVPPTYAFVLATYVGTIIVFQFIGIFESLGGILRNRLQLELVPDRYRNAVYSLFSTFIVSFGAPLVFLGGFVIDEYGFAAGILLNAILSAIGIFITGLGLYWLPEPGTGQSLSLEKNDINNASQ